MKQPFLNIAILILMPFFAFAQDGNWQKVTQGKYTYKYVQNDPMKARYYTLDNGLTVILSVNKEKPRIQTIIATKAGSKTDPADHTGLAHYLEHMLFKGTDKYGSLDWNKEKVYLQMIDDLYEKYNKTIDENTRKKIYHQIDSVSGLASKYAIANEYDKMTALIGAQGTNAFTSFEVTAYINDIPSNYIDQWLRLEAERYRNPILRIFHTELEAVYEEKNRSLDSDDDKVFERLFAELFKKHNYGLQTTIGTVPHLKNPSLKEIRKYFYKNYVPNNMCVIMAGDFDPDVVIEKIDNAFSYMKASPVSEYTFEPEAPISKPIEANIYGPDAEYITMAYRFPGASSKEALILDLLSNILSNGNAGLMDINLVKTQKVLSASGGSYVLKDYGILYIDGKAKEGQKLEDVKALVLGEITNLKNGNFDESLLQAVINNYKKMKLQGNESNGGRAFTLLDAFTSGVDWQNQVMLLDNMSKITKSDIQEFARKWLHDNYVCIYKRIGKDENIEKIEKPEITPVSVNRDAQSDFVKNLAAMPAKDILPVFLNYASDIATNVIEYPKAKLQLLSVKNNTNSLFSQYYYVDLGSYHNKLLPIAMDYLQYVGTKNKSAAQFSKDFYTLACDFGVSAGSEESYVYLNGLQENYTKALILFEDLLQNAQGDEKALKEMIAGIKKKRKDEKLNKNAIRSGLRYYALYGADNPFNYKLSDAELDKIKAEDLIEIIHSLCQYNHKILYYGPENSDMLVGQLQKYHVVNKAFITTPPIHRFTPVYNDNPSVLWVDYDMVQSELVWARNDVKFNVKDLSNINMFNEYYGGSMSGIVFQDIRESKALAYSTYAYYAIPQKQDDPFYMLAYVGCQADKMKESIKAMNS